MGSSPAGRISLSELFRVWQGRKLVAGIYSGAVSFGLILQHGDFGLGTFENLDGEMVVLDGRVYRVGATELSRRRQQMRPPRSQW